MVKLYYCLLALSTILAVSQWKYLKTADKIIGIYIIMAGLEEIITVEFRKVTGSNYLPSHFYTPLELLVLCLYFNETIVIFKKRNLGIYIGLAGIVISAIDSIFLQPPPKNFNSYFLLFEACTVIIMCLICFFQILMDEERMPYTFTNFWVTIALLFFWCSTFTGWGVFTLLGHSEKVVSIFTKVLAASNLFLYATLAVVLARYRKLIPSGA